MIVRALASCLALAVVACGGGGSGSSTVMIVASEGGTVELAGSETRLDIPPGALAEDTEVTVSVGSLDSFGPLEHGRSDVLVIEPAGLTLSAPADIVIDPGSPAIEATASVALRQYLDGAWLDPEGAGAELVSGGLIAASIRTLAPTALVVQDAPEGPVGDVRGRVLHIYTEAPLPGITFTLIADDQVLATAVSDAEGVFTFADVAVGTYSVHADVSPDENCYSDPTDKDVDVVEQGVDVFFGFVPGPCGG